MINLDPKILLASREVVVSFLTFLSSFVLTQALGLEGFGQWGVILSIVGIYEVCVRFPAEQLTIYFTSHRDFDFRLYLGYVILLQIVFCLFFIFLASAFLLVDYIRLNVEERIPLLIIFFVIFLSPLRFIYVSIISAHLNFGRYGFFGLISIAFASLYLIICLCLYVFHINKIVSFSLLILVPCLMSSLVIFYLKDSFCFKEIRIHIFYEVFQKAKYLYFSGLVGISFNYLPIFLSSLVGDLKFTGAIVLTLGILSIFNKLIYGVFVPIISHEMRGFDSELATSLLKIFKVICVIILILSIFLNFASHYIVTLVYGFEFEISSFYLKIFAPFVLFSQASHLFNSYFNSLGYVKYIWLPNALSVLLSSLIVPLFADFNAEGYIIFCGFLFSLDGFFRFMQFIIISKGSQRKSKSRNF